MAEMRGKISWSNFWKSPDPTGKLQMQDLQFSNMSLGRLRRHLFPNFEPSIAWSPVTSLLALSVQKSVEYKLLCASQHYTPGTRDI